MKYIGAWFADGANNVSNLVVLDSINLVLPGDTIGQAQVTQYRRTFEPGQTVTVTLAVTNGDADLYIWRPGSLAMPDYISNRPGTATEQLVFTAVEGEYLIEVHGYQSSQFNLDLSTGSLGMLQPSSPLSSKLRPLIAKPLPPHPLVVNMPYSATPAEQPKHFFIYR